LDILQEPLPQQKRRLLVGPIKVTSILIRKDKQRLYLLNGVRILKAYSVALGRNPVGHKKREGDSRTPEGLYSIDFKNPLSQYHKSLKIDYPNQQDLKKAAEQGVDPGKDIFIHGFPIQQSNKRWLIERIHPNYNWTQGCIAVTNQQIDEIYNLVEVGTPVEICPAT
jgi:murein L,D-transpeptidase YafK